MDLSHPLSSISPSLEAEALTVLARTESALTGRQVARLARRGSHVAIATALERLARQGIVHVHPAGSANLYRLNRDHLLVPGILELIDGTGVLRARLACRMEEWRIPCRHASLFGSAARGEAGPESDIDVLVVRPPHLDDEESVVWTTQLADLEAAVWSWTGNSLSWFETTEDDLRRTAAAGEPLFESWRSDGLLLCGDPLESLLRRLDVRPVA